MLWGFQNSGDLRKRIFKFDQDTPDNIFPSIATLVIIFLAMFSEDRLEVLTVNVTATSIEEQGH